LKTFSARRINEKRGMPGIPVWQRNYYERIIRNENELNQIREYIANNPANWLTDENNPVTP
jgi:putative transposase